MVVVLNYLLKIRNMRRKCSMCDLGFQSFSNRLFCHSCEREICRGDLTMTVEEFNKRVEELKQKIRFDKLKRI
jgi:hypothetical protein